MLTPDRGALRSLRSVVLAVLVLGLSLGAHSLGGGQAPPAGPAAAVGAVVLLGCALATRWRLSAAAVTALLASSQLVLHHLLAVLAPSSGAGAATGGAGHAGAHAAPAGAHTAHGAAGDLWLGGPAGSEVLMLVAHTAAAVALALVCSRGEDALWDLCAWLAPLAPLPLPVTPAPVGARPSPTPAPAPRPLPRWAPLRRTRRRGPPPLLAA